MPAHLLDGQRIAASIKAELAPEIAALKAKGVTPGLAAILVGENPASQIYVHSKIRSCEALGLYSEQVDLPAATGTEDILHRVRELNAREEIDGILVQLPLPAHVDAKAVLLAVDPAKDVDGFNPVNVGNVVLGRGGMVPCTPAGIIQILERSNIPIQGKRAVVVGRSDTVGKPTAALLLQRNATVTVCHSRTPHLAMVTRDADILVAAIGRPAVISWDFIKQGATVIDVGITRLSKAEEVRSVFHEPLEPLERLAARGSVLVGDVQPEDARQLAGAYTPVPGGVGPVTIAMLMSNTVRAAGLRRADGRNPA